MHVRKIVFVGLGVLSVLAVAVGLAFASDPSPDKEPATSPFFEATLQQAVDELDGKATAPSPAQPQATQHYTTDPNVWPECEFGFTRDLAKWPACHFTSDPAQASCKDPWPTADYTWDTSFWWDECKLTQDPGAIWCEPRWTIDPQMGPQCDPRYTADPGQWPWCDPRFTRDPAQWPGVCLPEGAEYTYSERWPECVEWEFTTDPYLWAACHYTSDPLMFEQCFAPYPTQDYTSNPELWKECPGPGYTEDVVHWPWCAVDFTQDPRRWPVCDKAAYTQDAEAWPWCGDPLYTSQPAQWPECHFTSDPETWPQMCDAPYPTMDFTWDASVWPECDALTQDPQVWPWCGTDAYTQDTDLWPWCNSAWTQDVERWSECAPGYTNDPDIWKECSEGLYTQQPTIWPECSYHTADARVWPECHYTSDPRTWPVCGGDQPPFPTKDYTTDPRLWTECERAPNYTTDPGAWPECHYTSDPQLWPECRQPEAGDLGDAPDSTNHAGANMNAYPGIQARYPTVFDPATGLPQGPKHFQPRADAWLGPWVTLESDADLMPDEDGVTNIDPATDTPDRDEADDGLHAPVILPFCANTVISYTITVTPGATTNPRYVNVWFDWLRDGDWEDVPQCPRVGPAPEWAVQNQVISLGPGTHVLVTPAFLSWNPPDPDISEIWMRISISDAPAPIVPGTNLADGRGPRDGYKYGETEDYHREAVCPAPVADFVWDPPTICTDTIVSFFDMSTSALPLLGWSWNFGGLGVSSTQHPTFTFGTVGTYDVALTVANVCAPDTITKTLVVTDCPSQEPDYDIYIKDNDADDGSVPSSSPWWLSPDIWVRNDGDCTQSGHQNPTPGTTATVCVQVRNRMTAAVDDITVNMYWANAALGLTWPGSFTYLGTFNIANLGGGATKVRKVLWNVPYTTGHFCLRARADAPKDPLGSGPDTVSPVDYVQNNNNIAQKNANTVAFDPITECGVYTTTVQTDTVYFDAVNTTNAKATVDIQFDSSDFPLGSGTFIVEPGTLWGRWDTLTNFNQSGNTLLPTDFAAVMGGIEMAPHETARMTMTVAAEIDERFTISVVELIDNTEVGGIDYVRDLPRCVYLPVILKNLKP